MMAAGTDSEHADRALIQRLVDAVPGGEDVLLTDRGWHLRRFEVLRHYLAEIADSIARTDAFAVLALSTAD